MRDRKNGWFTFESPDSTSLPGVYATTDGGNTWSAISGSLQWGDVRQFPLGSMIYSAGGIAAISDSICIISSSVGPFTWAPFNNPNSIFGYSGNFVSIDAGRTWVGSGPLGDFWGITYMPSCHRFFEFPTGDNLGDPAYTQFYSSDTGTTWQAGATIPSVHNGMTGDIEGEGSVLYLQSDDIDQQGMYRSTDFGKSWKRIGGPWNFDHGTRFCVLPSCNGGKVIALGYEGVWLTTDGGDGALPEPEGETITTSAIPQVKACEASKALTRIFSNACPNGFTFTSASLEGDTIHFSLDSLPPMPLSFGGGANDSFYVRFTPNKVAGSFSTKLHITGTINRPDTSLPFDTTIDINATATPEPLQLFASTYSLDFGALSTCHGARYTSVVFTNHGCGPDTITRVAVSGAGFTGLKDSLPIVVQPGDSVRLDYHFAPPDTGAFSGAASLHVTSMGLTEDPSITLVGAGVQGVGVLSLDSTRRNAGSFSFCAGDTSLVDTLRNTGCDTLVISNMRFLQDGAWSSASSLRQDSLLMPGASAVFQFYFSPRTKGAHAAQLTFHSRNIRNDPGHDTTVALAGFGLGGAKSLSSSLRSADFGAIYACEVRDTTIVLHNPGCDTLRVDSARFSNGSYTSAGTYPLVIPPDSSATVTVHLTADTTGMAGTLEFFSNADTGSTIVVPLAASIIPPAQLHLSLSSPDSGKDGSVIMYYLVLTGTGGRRPPLRSLTFDLTHNDDLLSFVSTAGVTVTGTGGTPALQVQHFTWGSRAGSPTYADTIGSLTFLVYLTDSASTQLTLSNVTFDNSLHLPNDCIASIGDSASSFTYLYRCGEHLIQDAMLGVPIHIESIVPNPARDEITVNLSGTMDADFSLYDVLGHNVLDSHGAGRAQHVPTAALPEGAYYLRVSSGGFAETRRVVIER